MIEYKTRWTASELLNHDFDAEVNLACDFPAAEYKLIDLVLEVRRNVCAAVFELPYAVDFRDLPKVRGVYFAVIDGEIVYVGMSENIRARWASRQDMRCSKHIPVYYLEFPSDRVMPDLAQTEALLIALLAPKNNRIIAKNGNNSFAWRNLPGVTP